MLSKRAGQTCCYGLILFGSVLRIVSCFQHNPTGYLFSDPKRHWLNGERLFAPDFMGTSDPILYQIYVAIVRALTADNSIFIAGVCALLSVLMPWTYYRAVRELGLAKAPSLMVWALIAVTPSLIAIYHYFMMETLLLALVGVALWMTARHLRKGSTSAFLWAVFLWLLASLTKPTVVPLAALCVGWMWWAKSRRISDGLWAAALAVILLIPNTIRTKHYLGFLAPLGNPWLTKIQHRSGDKTIRISFGTGQWNFSSPSCYMQPLAPLSFWAMRRAWEESVTEISISPKNGALDWKSAYQNLNTDWREWLNQLAENVLMFFFAASWPDNNTAEWDGWLSSICRWIWAPVIFFVFDCNIREFIRKRFDLLPVAVTVFTLFLAFQNIVTSEGRYRKPLEPLLLMNLVWATSARPKRVES
ncbi:MAG TPA: glycosyltransferase family 39 protein [Terrimicrobiaceae bacterium]